MKKVIKLVREYADSTFNWKLYSSIFGFVVVLIAINYAPWFQKTFEKDIIRPYHGTCLEPLIFFVVMYIPYLITCGFVSLFSPKKEVFKQAGFWVISVLIFALIASYRGAWFESFAQVFRKGNWNKYVYYFKMYDGLENVILVTFSLLVLYFTWDRKRINHFYGVQVKNADIKPYVIMLAIIALPIFLASLTPSFQDAYPKLNNTNYGAYAPYSGYSKWQLAFFYELVYLSGFVMVELVFRGAMIYSLERYLGKYVVLPMVVVYAVLHFGKPMGETISSIFGGYILGILALKTKNIYGGIFIHMGVALLMELFAFISLENGWLFTF